MRTKGAPAGLEARRLRAAELLSQGKGTSAVARLVGVTPSCVSKWKKALLRRGPEGLRARPHPGRKPRLNAVQKRRLEALLKKGAVAAGYDSELWTCRRVRDLIGKTQGVWYDFNHVGRILHALGFSVQKPEARARERDDRAIARWRKKDWPRIKKTRGG
ncbi:MAG: transposase [Phycisphaerales bacterium]|nr:transposase [Phycisphaerales bacterium]